ncbi:uncharacterized protein AAKU67_003050 [Oxalobacteraceae bacterium GrIS 2.11]
MKLISVKNICGLLIGLSLVCGAAAADEKIHSDWHVNVLEFSRAHFKHPAWGFSHSVRDYRLAKWLAQSDKVTLDDDVLFAAAYLHDMAAFQPWEKEGVDHADQAAAIVDTVLNGSGFPVEKIDAVRNAIRTHMYDRDPAGPESIYLHDADALDWLGAIGVARILALIDPNGGSPDSHEIVAMLEEYTGNVPKGVLSPSGKLLAKQREAESLQYLQQLKSESENLNSL